MFDKLAALADRLDGVRDQVSTEEATKTALILPFIRELGYDVFDPSEVIPEFTADVGIKRGEKVDYAICHNGKPIILIEAKTLGAKLDSYSSQLYRYFSTTNARIAILTDGVEYRFFSDLKDQNKLDAEPFFVFSFDQLRKDDAVRLEQFTKLQFDLDAVLAQAESLQYRTAIRSHFAREMREPSDAFVRHFADPIHSGRLTQGVVDKFRLLVKSAISDYVDDAVERRLQAALQASKAAPIPQPSSGPTAGPEPVTENSKSDDQSEGVETTLEELHGYCVIKAILRDQVDPNRIIARDVRSYFGVLLDDNNRKPVCRLWFNRAQKYLGVFNEQKEETRIPIQAVDDLFQHTEAIKQSLQHVL